MTDRLRGAEIDQRILCLLEQSDTTTTAVITLVAKITAESLRNERFTGTEVRNRLTYLQRIMSINLGVDNVASLTDNGKRELDRIRKAQQ